MERSGHPALDQALADFLAQDPEIPDEWLDMRNELRRESAIPSLRERPPEPHKRLSQMRFDPALGPNQPARKLCGNVADLFDAFLRERGFDVVREVEDRHPTNLLAQTMDPNPFDLVYAGELDIETGLDWSVLYGYEDGKYRRRRDKTHQASVVELDGELLAVDWTAGQYGFLEFPLLQRFDRETAAWQREWPLRPELDSLAGTAALPAVAGPAPLLER